MAFFGEAEDPETGEYVFVIYFSEMKSVTPQAGSYGFIGRNSERPGTGSYSVIGINDDDDEIPEDEFVMVVNAGYYPGERHHLRFAGRHLKYLGLKQHSHRRRFRD